MNATIRVVLREGLNIGLEVYGVYDGFTLLNYPVYIRKFFSC
ncbi:MAG: 6-phosphofructokinase [Psychromonas sp.]|jgi:6-phosphofructokinase